MMTAHIQALLTAIEYPEEVLEVGGVAVLRVDGEAVRVQVVGKQLVLSQIIDRAEEDVPELAALATGRILRDEAVLAWDAREAAMIVWQALAPEAGAQALAAGFERFMDVCDWWRERASALHAPPPAFPEMVIHP